MKIQYALIAMLAIGVFGASFAFAENSESTDTVSTDVVVNAESIGSVEIDNSIDEAVEVSEVGKHKLVGFAAYRSGFGPLTKGDQGYLGTLGIVKVGVSDGQTDRTLYNARLKFGGKTYKAIGYSSDNTDTKMILYLIGSGKRLGNAFENEASIKSEAIGTLTLENKAKYSTFQQWDSSLVLKDGTNAGTWTGQFYLSNEWKKVRKSNEGKDGAIRPMPAERVRADGETKIEARTAIKANNEVREVNVRWWNKLFPKRVEATAQVDATAEAQ